MNRTFHPLLLAATALLAVACATPGGMSFSARNEALFGGIETGMTQAQVRGQLGTPDMTMPFPRLGQVAWDYRYQDAWGYLALMSVTFGPDGRVVSRTSQRLNDGGDHK